MDDQANAAALHSQVVLLRMQGKTTEELQFIWQENDRSKWAKEDFDAIEKLLLERVGKLPQQKHFQAVEQQSTAQTVSYENLNTKYPYLTAYVGFLALSLLLAFVAAFIPRLQLIVILVGGFYIFRFVIEKNVLPYVQQK